MLTGTDLYCQGNVSLSTFGLMASQSRGEMIINSFRLFKFCCIIGAHQHIDDPHFQIETTRIRAPGVQLII
jgi:hypothetical protein